MNASVRVFAFALAAAIAGLSSFAASSSLADTITINQQSVQILKSAPVVCFAGTNTVCANTTPQNPVIGGNDTLNFKITFTNNGAGGTDCNPGNTDTIAHGLTLIAVTQIACADPFSAPFIYAIPSFVPKTVGGVKIGTYFAVNGLGTVTAKITTLATPPNTCSKYTLEFQATKLNLSSITHNPISLDIDNADDDVGCININNALIGTPF